MLTATQVNQWRIFPRLIAFFMAHMWMQFNNYFFSIPMAQQPEWSLVQYGVITATFVGFAKFYMETPTPREGKHGINDDP